MYVITKSPLTISVDLSPLALVHRLRNYLNLEYRSRQITANKIGSVDHDASDWSIHNPWLLIFSKLFVDPC